MISRLIESSAETVLLPEPRNKYRLKDSCKVIADAEFEDRAEKFEEYCTPIVEEDEWDKL